MFKFILFIYALALLNVIYAFNWTHEGKLRLKKLYYWWLLNFNYVNIEFYWIGILIR